MVAERELFFHKNDHANFSGGKTYNEAFWIEYYLRIRETKIMLNLSLKTSLSWNLKVSNDKQLTTIYADNVQSNACLMHDKLTYHLQSQPSL